MRLASEFNSEHITIIPATTMYNSQYMLSNNLFRFFHTFSTIFATLDQLPNISKFTDLTSNWQ